MSEFSAIEWAQVSNQLEGQETDYGLPERNADSVILASWNIRKLGGLIDSRGNPSRSSGAWQIIKDVCERCDFVAIQEVQDSLESLRALRDALGPNYAVVVSDIAGGVPGRSGMRERLAFLYNTSRIEQTELASDITFERSAVFNQLLNHRREFSEALDQRQADLDAWDLDNVARVAAGKRKRAKPPFVMPRFLQFIRSPHIASFTVKPNAGAKPYEFSAVNAHLLYGDARKQKKERELEFKALLAWIIDRARERERNYAENIFLFGDLNLDFKETDVRRRAIEQFIVDLNRNQLRHSPAKVNFPFLDRHPSMAGVFRTNARRDQTYDQIALFADDRRLPPPSLNEHAGMPAADGYDFGMFDFVRLIFDAFPSIAAAPKRQRYAKFEHDVSDHMPIWIRLPIPVVGQTEHVWQ